MNQQVTTETYLAYKCGSCQAWTFEMNFAEHKWNVINGAAYCPAHSGEALR